MPQYVCGNCPKTTSKAWGPCDHCKFNASGRKVAQPTQQLNDGATQEVIYTLIQNDPFSGLGKGNGTAAGNKPSSTSSETGARGGSNPDATPNTSASTKTSPVNTTTSTETKKPVRTKSALIQEASELWDDVTGEINALKQVFDLEVDRATVQNLKDSFTLSQKPAEAIETLTNINAGITPLRDEHKRYLDFSGRLNKLIDSWSDEHNDKRNAIVDYNRLIKNKTKTKGQTAERLYKKYQPIDNEQVEQQAEQQKAEQQQAEQQKAEQQKAEQQQAEQQKAEQQKAEQQKAEQQKAEQQKAEQQKAEQQKTANKEQEPAHKQDEKTQPETTERQSEQEATQREEVEKERQRQEQEAKRKQLEAEEEQRRLAEEKRKAEEAAKRQQALAKYTAIEQAVQEALKPLPVNPNSLTKLQAQLQQLVTNFRDMEKEPTATAVAIEGAIKAISEELPTVQGAKQLAAERAEAFKKYTNANEVEAALVKGNTDPAPVTSAQQLLQDAVTALDKLRTDESKTGKDIEGAINGIAGPLATVQQAKQLAAERAEAFKKYTTANEVEAALMKGDADRAPVTSAQQLLQDAVTALDKLRTEETKTAKDIESAINGIAGPLATVQQAKQLAAERAEAFKKYTNANEVEAALVKVNTDPAPVKSAQVLLQNAVNALDKLRTEETKTAKDIEGAINGIADPLGKVQQAKQLAAERAEAFKKYTNANEVEAALVKVNTDPAPVTSAQLLLQNAVTALDKLRTDETKTAKEIEGAINGIAGPLATVQQAKQQAAERAEAFKKYALAKEVTAALIKSDVEAVTNAQVHLKKAVDELQELATDGTKPARDIDKAVKRIREELAKVLDASPVTVAGVQEQADQLAIPANERQFIKTLAQGNLELAKGLADAVAGVAAKGEAAAQATQVAEAKIKVAVEKAADEDEKIRTAKGKIAIANNAIQAANEKIQTAESKIQGTGKKVDTAENNIKKADREIEQALSKQYDALQALNKVLWEKLSPEAKNICLTDYNRLNNEAHTSWGNGAHEAAVGFLRQNYEALKKQSTTGGLAALKFSKSTGQLTEEENKQATAQQNKVAAEQAKATALLDQTTAEQTKAAALQEKTTAEQAVATAGQEQAAAEQAKAAVLQEKATAEREKLTAEAAAAEAAAAPRRLVNAVRFGPLAEPAIDPEQVAGLTETEKLKRTEVAQKREAATKAILAHCKDYPDLALDALDIIGDAQNLEAFTDKIANLGPLLASGFGGTANPAEARKMTQNALKMAVAAGGPDFFERMTEFYKTPSNLDPDQNRAGGDGKLNTKAATLKYTGAIGQAMLDLDPGSNAVRKLRDSLQFHPDSLKDPLPVLAARVETFCKMLEDPEKLQGCQEALAMVDEAPQAGTAQQKLVQGALGIAGNVTKDQAKVAVLSAMLTPMTQGQVASCFATCNCMDYQERQPVAMMKDLATIVKTGKLSKAGLDPVPVVINIPEGENSLLRSFEYSVATLGARTANSDTKSRLDSAMNSGMKPLWEEPGQAQLRSLDKGFARAQTARDQTMAAATLVQTQALAAALLARDTAKAAARVIRDNAKEAARLQREQTMAAAVAEQDRAFDAALEDRNQKNSAALAAVNTGLKDGTYRSTAEAQNALNLANAANQAAYNQATNDAGNAFTQANLAANAAQTQANTAADQDYTGVATAADEDYTEAGAAANNAFRRANTAANETQTREERALFERMQTLQAKVADTFNFSYNPKQVMTGTSSDGHSTQGGWVMKRKLPPTEPNGEPEEVEMTSEAEFKECLKAGFAAALGADVDPAVVEALVNDNTDAGLTKQILKKYSDPKPDGFGAGLPWAQRSGGMQQSSKKVLFPPGEPKDDGVFTADKVDPLTATEKLLPETQQKALILARKNLTAQQQKLKNPANTKALLVGLVNSLKGSPDDKVTLGVPNHAERAMPKHPSLDRLKGGGENVDVAAAVEAEFVMAKETADNPLDEDKKAHVHEKALQSLIVEMGLDLKAFRAKGKQATGNQKPADLKQTILTHFREEYASKFVVGADFEKTFGAKVDALLIKELYPEFVIADTNWGDGEERIVHVVAPDPMTGEPKLWEKREPGGTMEPADDDWINGNWAATKMQQAV